MVVKNRLREILDERGVKQTWLAEKAGIDRSTLSSIIANRHSTSLEAAMRISKALDLEINNIFQMVDE